MLQFDIFLDRMNLHLLADQGTIAPTERKFRRCLLLSGLVALHLAIYGIHVGFDEDVIAIGVVYHSICLN